MECESTVVTNGGDVRESYIQTAARHTDSSKASGSHDTMFLRFVKITLVIHKDPGIHEPLNISIDIELWNIRLLIAHN